MTTPPPANIVPRYTNIASFFRLPIYNMTDDDYFKNDKKVSVLLEFPLMRDVPIELVLDLVHRP